MDPKPFTRSPFGGSNPIQYFASKINASYWDSLGPMFLQAHNAFPQGSFRFHGSRTALNQNFAHLCTIYIVHLRALLAAGLMAAFGAGFFFGVAATGGL